MAERNVSFGPGQWNNPTPRGVDTAVKVFAAFSLVTIGFINTTDLVSDHAAHLISGLLGYLNTLTLALAPLFGIQIGDETKVSAGKVDVMENK
jgi:hypothetical protein